MAWVTLSLRKMELIHQHNDYEMEDLQISREERQMARHYQLLKRQALNSNSRELSDLRSAHRDTVSGLKSKYKSDDDASAEDKSKNSSEYQTAYNDEKEKYDEEVNTLKTEAEDEVADLEAEAADRESQLEDEKVQVETQMEAVAAELEALKQQISTDIQNDAIQLH